MHWLEVKSTIAMIKGLISNLTLRHIKLGLRLEDIRLKIQRKSLDKLILEAGKTKPIEACALLLGKFENKIVYVCDVIPVCNIEKSTTRFLIDSETLYSILQKAEIEGMELVGIFHSHPAPAIPSSLDLKFMELWPIVWLILSTFNGDLSAYQWHEGRVLEVKVDIE